MKLIVGLGNPGSRYSDTRHNAGRLLIEDIARREGLSFSRKKNLHASIVSAEWDGCEVILAFPHTYMNLSGTAVKSLLSHFEISPARDILVVVDDLALPFRRLRLRAKGSDGGHKGLRSIHECLRTQDYARLRLGIGMPENESRFEGLSYQRGNAEAYVLSAFSAAEKKGLKDIFRRATETCRLWATQSIEAAMNSANQDTETG